MKLIIDAEWLKRHIESDGDEGEIGAGVMAYAYDPDRIAKAITEGRDPTEGFETYFAPEVQDRLVDIERVYERQLDDHFNERYGDDYANDDHLDVVYEREADGRFAQDMADDRAFHTVLPGESLSVRWMEMFGTLPVWLTANFFEQLPDETWKCQIKQGPLYATLCGFPSREELESFINQWLIEVISDE